MSEKMRDFLGLARRGRGTGGTYLLAVSNEGQQVRSVGTGVGWGGG